MNEREVRTIAPSGRRDSAKGRVLALNMAQSGLIRHSLGSPKPGYIDLCVQGQESVLDTGRGDPKKYIWTIASYSHSM